MIPYGCHLENMSEYFVVESLLVDIHLELDSVMESSITTQKTRIKVLDMLLRVVDGLITTITNWLSKFTAFIRRQINNIKSYSMKSNRVVAAEIKYWENRKNDLKKKVGDSTGPEYSKIREEISEIEIRIEKLRYQFSQNNKGVLVTETHWHCINEGMINIDRATDITKSSYRNFRKILDDYDDLIRGFNRTAYNANMDTSYKRGENDKSGVFGYIGAQAAIGATQASKQALGNFTYKGRRDVAEDDDTRVAFNSMMDEIQRDMFTDGGSRHDSYKRSIDLVKMRLEEIKQDTSSTTPSFISGKYIPDSFITNLQTTVNDADTTVKKVKTALTYYKEIIKSRKLYLSKADTPDDMQYEGPKGMEHFTFAKAPEYLIKVVQMFSGYVNYFTEIYNYKADLSLTITTMQEKIKSDVI